MTRAELLEKLMEINKGNQVVFDRMMAIREQVNEYEIELYNYEKALSDILEELYGITDLHEDLFSSDFYLSHDIQADQNTSL